MNESADAIKIFPLNDYIFCWYKMLRKKFSPFLYLKFYDLKYGFDFQMFIFNIYIYVKT